MRLRSVKEEPLKRGMSNEKIRKFKNKLINNTV
jgi:hypothetical protein